MRWAIAAVLLGLTTLAAAGGARGDDGAILQGAGATFPRPLYESWTEALRNQSGTRIAYRAEGSGEGIRQILAREVDFGASDAFLTDEEMKKSEAPLLHVPTCVGAVVVTYNLPGNPTLRFTPEVLAAVFLGEISDWSDVRLTKINPDVKLPKLRINVVHRSDASGTTFLFTDYLSKVSPAWREKAGAGKTIRWPDGMGLEGNPAVAEMVRRVPGTVGYVELNYALHENLPTAMVRNGSGNYVKPTPESLSKAAEIPLPADMRVLLTDTNAKDGYPVGAFTYLIVYREQAYGKRSRERAALLARTLWWMVHDGQKSNERLAYARLPEAAVKNSEALIRSMTYQGAPLLPEEEKEAKSK